MKKLLISITILYTFFFILNTRAIAVSPTIAEESEPTTTQPPTQIPSSDLINNLKDRIASRVAQLKLVEKRGMIGTVVEVSDTQITVLDSKDNKRFIDVDELTKFSSPSAKGSFGISDIEKGSKVGALGLYNKQSKRILARFVDTLIIPLSIHGVISDKDSENFTLTITSKNSPKIITDIETITKIYSYTKENGLLKSGFSKTKAGTRVILIGFPDKNDKTRIIASRILLFPELPIDPTINVALPTSIPTVTSTPTESVKKTTTQ